MVLRWPTGSRYYAVLPVRRVCARWWRRGWRGWRGWRRRGSCRGDLSSRPAVHFLLSRVPVDHGHHCSGFLFCFLLSCFSLSLAFLIVTTKTSSTYVPVRISRLILIYSLDSLLPLGVRQLIHKQLPNRKEDVRKWLVAAVFRTISSDGDVRHARRKVHPKRTASLFKRTDRNQQTSLFVKVALLRV